jgi:phospholipid/cholesterol/gamma-HCH transport system substrate-binding protein
MKDSVESRLGLFFAFAIIALLIILEFAGGLDFVKPHYRLHALFKNVQELKTGDFVKMAGVQVGRVEGIALTTNGLADVTMNLQRNADVKIDSVASLKFTGLMAENYVSIAFGTSATRAEAGAYLQTVEQADLSVLMTKLDNVATGVENLTRSFSGEKIDNLLGPITDLIKNNQTNLSATFANVRTVTQRIADGQGTVGKLINEDTLYVSALSTISNLQNSTTNIKVIADQATELLTNANSTITRINSGEGTIGKLVKDDTLYVETTGTMTNLHQIMLKINHGQGTVGQLINDDSTLKNIKISMQKLDKATESLEDTGPLSVLGTMAASLF